MTKPTVLVLRPTLNFLVILQFPKAFLEYFNLTSRLLTYVLKRMLSPVTRTLICLPSTNEMGWGTCLVKWKQDIQDLTILFGCMVWMLLFYSTFCHFTYRERQIEIKRERVRVRESMSLTWSLACNIKSFTWILSIGVSVIEFCSFVQCGKEISLSVQSFLFGVFECNNSKFKPGETKGVAPLDLEVFVIKFELQIEEHASQPSI